MSSKQPWQQQRHLAQGLGADRTAVPGRHRLQSSLSQVGSLPAGQRVQAVAFVLDAVPPGHGVHCPAIPARPGAQRSHVLLLDDGILPARHVSHSSPFVFWVLAQGRQNLLKLLYTHMVPGYAPQGRLSPRLANNTGLIYLKNAILFLRFICSF